MQLYEAAAEQFGLLANACGPALGENPSQFKRELFARYAFFFRWDFLLQRDNEIESAATLYGPSAFTMCMRIFEERIADDKTFATLTMLKPLSGFRRLMTLELKHCTGSVCRRRARILLWIRPKIMWQSSSCPTSQRTTAGC